ncbi:hypothetical protein NECAME_06206 [Necator americanus]|uniref:Uncharacterized protein n=1 Tax=Necator americanus TaxID=51031 RepID=W2TVX4_NECAM|nr:hypothetical protein NECAME_06206 [Necator americanus]ETN85789.1 hypothetical protein NECAME_06206 [Necator americanus]
MFSRVTAAHWRTQPLCPPLILDQISSREADLADLDSTKHFWITLGSKISFDVYRPVVDWWTYKMCAGSGSEAAWC